MAPGSSSKNSRLITIAAMLLVTAGAGAVPVNDLPALLDHEPIISEQPGRVHSPEEARRAFGDKAEAKRTAAIGRNRPTTDAIMADVRERLDIVSAARALGIERHSSLRHLASVEAVAALGRLESRGGSSLRIVWNDDTSTPRFIAGRDLHVGSGSREARALAFLEDVGALFQLSRAAEELVAFHTVSDETGLSAVRLQQVHRGLDVWGHDAVVRFDAGDAVVGVSGRLLPTPDLDVVPTIDAAAARAFATEALSARDGVSPAASTTELLIIVRNDAPRLAWKVLVEAGLAYRREAFVDARSGKLLHDVTLVPHGDRLLGDDAHGQRGGGAPSVGQGVDLDGQTQTLQLWNESGTHFMINTTKPMFDLGASTMPNDPRGGIMLIDAQNGDGSSLFHVTSTNPNDWSGFANAVSAATFAGSVYDYFDDRHSRNSIDGTGMTMNLIVNFQNNFNNAFWNGTFMVFGNGDGNAFSDLAGALDVTAHEMSHGVIEHSANLIYEFQPGALNEHFADVFGASTEFFVKGGSGNWLLGEDVTTPSTAGDALRDMENPDGPLVAFGGQQPAHMDDFQDLPASTDNGGVHINSGIPNRAFFLASTAASMDVGKTERIWYRALTQFLVRESQFVDFRLALVQSANDLFGATEVAAVEAALDGVGIVDGTGTGGGGDPLPDNNGVDFLAVADAADGNVYRTTIPFDAQELVNLTQMPIGVSGRPSFMDDGSNLAFVGDDNNIYISASDGSSITPLSSSGEFWSIALNAEGTFLAATSIFNDGMIFVFDLFGTNDVAYELTSQNSTDGSVPDNVEFADVMEFSVVGDLILYDALNSSTFDGQTLEYWDINLLRLSDGETFRVFQPLPPTESIGNPTFAQNSDDIMAFDYLTDSGDILVMGFNFNTNTIGQMTNNFTSVGRPTFDGEDGSVYYHFQDQTTADVWNVQLESDGVTGIPATDQQYLIGALFPVHFTIGTRPTPVLLEEMIGSWRGSTVSLEWRVPDPGAYAGFHVERQVAVGDGFERRTDLPVPPGTGGAQRFDDAAPNDGRTSTTYRIVGVSTDGSTFELGRLDVRLGAGPIAGAAALLPVRPNPVGPATTLGFTLGEAVDGERIALSIYDVSGRLVAKPFDATQVSAGQQTIRWDGRNARGERLPAGTYFVHLSVGGRGESRKLTLLP